MQTHNEHSIDKFTVTLNVSPEINKDQVCTHITDEKDELLKLINQIFDDYFPENHLIEINRIILNVGTFSVTNFQKHFKNRVVQLLIAEIKKISTNTDFQNYTTTLYKESITQDQFRLLENYLVKGFSIDIPIPVNEFFDLNILIRKLLDKNPSRLFSTIQDIIHLPNVKKRLKQLKPETLIRLPKPLKEMIERNNPELSENEIYHLIISFFAQGTFSISEYILSPLDVDCIILELIKKEHNPNLVRYFLKHLSDKPFIYRLSGSLVFKQILPEFQKLDVLAPTIKEWKLSEILFQKLGYITTDSVSYRLLFLEYLSIPLHATEAKAQLIYSYLKNNRHLRAETDIENETLSTKIDNYSKTKSEIQPLIHYLKNYIFEDKYISTQFELSSDIKTIIAYLRYGTAKGSDWSELLNRQLIETPIDLSNAIRTYWQEEGFRYRIAFGVTLPVVQKLVKEVWHTHYSYTWWLKLKRKLSLAGNLPQTYNDEKNVRNLYTIYFEFLSRYHTEQWTEPNFEEWIFSSFNSLYGNNNISLSAQNLASPWQSISSSFSHLRHRSDIPNFPLPKEKHNKQRINELTLLLQNASSEDKQLDFEYLSDDLSTLCELFYDGSLSYDNWFVLFSGLTTIQLERFLAVLASSHYPYLKKQIEKINQILYTNEITFTFEIIHRKYFLILLETLYDIKKTATDEYLTHILLVNLSKDGILPLSLAEDEFTFYHIEYFPKVYKIIEKVSSKDVNNNAISSSEFNSLIQKIFPNISGFVIIYLSALEYFFNQFPVTSTHKLPESVYKYIYAYLNRNSKKFSASAFVYSINKCIETLYPISYESIINTLVDISNKKIEQGTQGFSILMEILLSQNHNLAILLPSTDTKTSEKINITAEIREQLNTEIQSIRSMFLIKGLSEYINYGTVYGTTSINTHYPIDWIKKQLKTVISNTDTHLILLIKDLLKDKILLKHLWDKKDTELEAILVTALSENRYKEFIQWQHEVKKFILWFYSSINKNEVSSITRKALFQLLLHKNVSTLNLSIYLQSIFKILTVENKLQIPVDYYLRVEKYKNKNKSSALFITILKNIEVPNRHIESSFEKNSHQKPAYSEKTPDELAALVNKGSHNELQLYFEFHLENHHNFRLFLTNKSIPRQLLVQLTPMLSESLQERLLSASAPSAYQYFRQIRNELNTFATLYNLKPEFKRTDNLFYISFLNQLYKLDYSDDINTAEQALTDAFQLPEKNRLLVKLKEIIQLNGIAVQQKFPVLYTIISNVYFREKPVQDYSKNGKWSEEEKSSQKTSTLFSDKNKLEINFSLIELKNSIKNNFEHIAGFVLTYLLALEQSYLFQTKNISEQIYPAIYSYLVNNKDSFSAADFANEISTSIASSLALEKKEIIQALFIVSKENIKQGADRFYALSEILTTQMVEPQTEQTQKISSNIVDHAPMNQQHLEETRMQQHREIKFQFFKRVLKYYIIHNTFLNQEEEGFNSMDEFKAYLIHFSTQNKDAVFPLIKNLISDTYMLDLFFKHNDTEIHRYVLQALADNRYEEFIKWHDEIIQFILWTNPSTNTSVISTNVRKSLIILLVNKNRITISLFTFLELVFENLRPIDSTILNQKSASIIKAYEMEKQPSPLFIKALERITILLSQKNRNMILKDIIKTIHKEKQPNRKLEQQLLVQNAGIIIIAPFLVHYFERLEMLVDGKFRDKEISTRAVQLLQFLATGTTEMQEHDLILNKIICGVEIDCFIEDSFEITEPEREMSLSLLNGILSNWSKMKTSSIDTLRETFLLRDGYIEQTESGWKLEVPRKSFDILVDLLPWSISLIKLSWMEASLTTHWARSIDG